MRSDEREHFYGKIQSPPSFDSFVMMKSSNICASHTFCTIRSITIDVNQYITAFRRNRQIFVNQFVCVGQLLIYACITSTTVNFIHFDTFE